MQTGHALTYLSIVRRCYCCGSNVVGGMATRYQHTIGSKFKYHRIWYCDHRDQGDVHSDMLHRAWVIGKRRSVDCFHSIVLLQWLRCVAIARGLHAAPAQGVRRGRIVPDTIVLESARELHLLSLTLPCPVDDARRNHCPSALSDHTCLAALITMHAQHINNLADCTIASSH